MAFMIYGVCGVAFSKAFVVFLVGDHPFLARVMGSGVGGVMQVCLMHLLGRFMIF